MLLTADRLWDGLAHAVHEGWALVVDGPVIVAAGPREELSAARPANEVAEVVDLGDVTVLPGLIDIHQHLCFDASDDPVGHLAARSDDAVLDAMRAAASRALAAGITTVRDLGDRGYLALTLRDRIRDDLEPGPRILAAGPPLTVTGGHCWYLGGEADGPDGLRAAVRDRAARGVDLVKVMVTGGFLTPTGGAPYESQYTLEELRAIVDEARRWGLPVAAHAHGGQGIVDALRAGVDSIEHCSFVGADGIEPPPGALEALARSGVTISLTAAMVSGPAPPPEMLKLRDAIVANVRELRRLGAQLVLSSDAGIAPNKPHDALPCGVEGFAALVGLMPHEVLAQVTSGAARACGLGGVTGTLEAGRDADLLAVAGNPLEDLSAITAVRAVYARGRRVGL